MPIHSCAGSDIKLACGCQLNKCSTCEATHSTFKCLTHLPSYPHRNDDKTYFAPGVKDNIPQNAHVCNELKTALSEMNVFLPGSGRALEIGAGIGRYAPMIMLARMSYEAVEPSPWAAEFIRKAYLSPVLQCSFEEAQLPAESFSLVLAVHVLEHLKDPRTALEKIFSLLIPDGQFILVVPDSGDLLNPDHYWFFTQKAITQWLIDVGFKDVRSVTKKIIKRENFIYAAGWKGRDGSK